MLNNRRFRPIRSAMALLLAGTIAITAVLPAYAYENEIHLINDLGGVGGELSLDQQVDRDWNEDLAGMAMSAWNDAHAGDEDAAPEMTVPAGPKATDSDLNGTADAAVYRAASASNLPKNIRKADSSEKNASCDFLCRLLKETLIPAEAFPREKSLKKMILALDKMNDRDYDVFRMDEEYSPKAGDIVFIAGVPMAAAPATGSELELTPNFFGELFSGGPAATASDLSASTEETGFAAEGKNGLKHRASRAVLGAVVIAGPEERGDGSISLIYSRAKDRVEAGTIQRKDGRIVGFADMEEIHDRYCGILEDEMPEEEQEEETQNDGLVNDLVNDVEEISSVEENIPQVRTEYTWQDSDMTVTAVLTDPEAIPDDAELQVSSLSEDSADYNAYMEALRAERQDATAANTALYDITFTADEMDEDGNPTGRTLEYEPRNDTVKVSFRFFGSTLQDQIGAEHPEQVQVYHLPVAGKSEDSSVTVSEEAAAVQAGDIAPAMLDCTVSLSTSVSRVEFQTGSFSAYAIVQGPGEIPMGWTKLSSINQFREMAADGLYIGTTGGYYLTGMTAPGSQDAGTTGIVKTKPAASYPLNTAVPYYFEAVEGTDNQFYVYCLGEGGEKQYVRNTGDANLTFTDETNRTAFTVQADNTGRFRFNSGNRYWNMWNGNNGNHIAAWTTANDGNNYFYLWKHDDSVTGDPYGLNGKSYGLMNWLESAVGRAMMAAGNGNRLEALAMPVMAKKSNNNDKLFVPDNSEISMWTFEWTGEADWYYLSTKVDGETKYLNIQSGGKLSLEETNTAAGCRIQVIPGNGGHSGELCLKSQNKTLTYTGKVETGFGTGGKAGSEWLKLVELSELTSDYFMTYSAQKVSVSDAAITNGSRIIVYTRTWNEDLKKYEFYAVDHDGSLVRCYESGDSVEWTGSRLNSMLWNFVEYYWEGTTTPNNYYELYNQYSEKYIAPQIKDGQVLSGNTIGINLDGRRNGQYYSSIMAWDELNYNYAGLKAEDGRIVSCPRAEADDFYFAIMQDIPVNDTLTTVPTVDHTQYGITMKIVDFNRDFFRVNSDDKVRKGMSDFLGSDNNYKNGNTESGLLSTNLVDGYPETAKGGNSLREWFAEAREVNHLFIDSTYRGTGYFEFDSMQNFASLDTEEGEFKVYKEIGTMDSGTTQFMTHGQFMPFNDLTAGTFTSVNKQNTTDFSGKALPESDPRKFERLYLVQNPNFYNGVELSASFTQTPDGLDDWGHDIIYEFTGDDDFWLYVDGELVIDLGGIHDALHGSVNYRTGEVEVNGKKTSLYELFYDNYVKRGHSTEEAQDYVNGIFRQNEKGQYVFRDYTTHTMNIYYMERGAGASNLHMRFNLASIKPGTVELSKQVTGVDDLETIQAEFPYQILYKDNNGAEHRLTNFAANDADRMKDYVIYKNDVRPVSYRKEITVDGINYDDVFFLKPGETCVISFPEDMAEYRIVECGVNTEIFDEVKENGTVLTGEAAEGSSGRKNFGIGYAGTEARARVSYENHVDPKAIRTLTFEKKVFDEHGTTLVETDTTQFSFRLYLATEFDDDIDNAPADMKTYHVKDADDNYCRWDASSQSFVSVGVSDYSQLSAEQKISVRFTTSMNGAISRISQGYTIEVRDILVGTRFKLVERAAEMPDGYSFRKYEYYENGRDTEVTAAGNDGEAGIADTILADKNSHVVVSNLKGWGLRVNKEWTDKDYMSGRDAAYFAVYTMDGNGSLALVDGTVRKLSFQDKPQTLYWYFLPLPVDVPFTDYKIREVKLTGSNLDIDENGTVKGYETITVLQDGDELKLNGTQKGETEASEFTYKVTYAEGEISQASNVRVDTVTNERPGILLKKQDMAGQSLAGAVFELKEKNGSAVIGTFTSDEDGIITEAFLGEGKEYTLTEKKAPRGYHGLAEALNLKLVDGVLTVTGTELSNGYFEIVNDTKGKTAELIVRNYPETFSAVKKDAANDSTLAGVTFALHEQKTVDGATQILPTPMEGFGCLVTDSNGVIPRINGELPAGTYELREVETLPGYLKLEKYIQFTISENGVITLGANCPEGTELIMSDSNGTVSYTLVIRNSRSVELPATGGPGTGLFLILGILLMGLAAAGLVMQRQRQAV